MALLQSSPLVASARGTGAAIVQSSPSPKDWTGTTLRVWTSGTPAAPAEAAAADWSAATGGVVEIEVIAPDERALKYAGLIVAQDETIDLIYVSAQLAGQFGDRLYEDLSSMAGDTSDFVPATIDVLTADGGLRGLPVHSEMQIFVYNKQHFDAAGIDPDNIPTTWDDLYSFAPQLTSGDRYPCIVPWSIGFGGPNYYLCFFNSIEGSQLLSDDRTQLLFDGDAGLQAFEAIERGFKSRFFDPNVDATADSYVVGRIFNGGGAASQMTWSELWAQAVSGNEADFGATIDPEMVGVTIMPGVAGGSGSINGFEGFGINRSSQQTEAALDYLRYLTGPEFQKALNLGGTLPSSRVSVLSDPEVVAGYPVGSVLAKQGGYNLDRYAAPYDWRPPFTDAVNRLYRGEITGRQAHQIAVDGVNEIIVNYLST
jgi:multiple sugar transport system substrate-binding protein